MVSATLPTATSVRDVVAQVPDPELPVITIADLGVLRDVTVRDDGHIEVVITPTYSGCPAMDAIRADISDRLAEHGWTDAEVRLELAPPWTTDWITPAGREALREAGIAPPLPVSGKPAPGSGHDMGPSGTVGGLPVSGQPAPGSGHDMGPSGTVGGLPVGGRASAPIPVALSVRCPQCGSPDTHEISRFGSTACKALWACRACSEPFDHVKAI